MSNKNKLSLIYDKRVKDFVVRYPRRCDGSLAMNHLIGNILKYRLPIDNHEYPNNYDVENFKDELDRRGYDVKTLKFSIKLKETQE